uniref:Variant surface glycoprotein 816 n=1 Tax=Trypanosoma brucei TaxID=5691 RepID=M4SYS6_9TRYP|nr:variant surface glycoprotein 816 [Trypanosoma brucei]
MSNKVGVRLIIAVTCFFGIIRCTSGDLNKDYDNAATDACAELLFLEEVAGAAETQANEAEKQIATAATTARLLASGRCQSKTAVNNLKFDALLVLTNSELSKADSIQAAATKLRDAAAVLRQRAAQARLALHRRPSDGDPTVSCKTSSNKKSVATTTGGEKTCGFKLTTPAATKAACAEENAQAPKIKAAAAALKQLTHLKLLKADDIAKISITGTALKVGSLTTSDQTFNSGICNDNGDAPSRSTNNALGLVDVELDATAITLEKHQIGQASTPGSPCQDITGEEYGTKTDAITNKVVAKAICDIRDTQVPTIINYLDKDISDLIADPEAQKVAELLLTGNIKKDGSEDHKKNGVKQLFGTDKGSLREKLINPLNEKHINYKVNEENSKKTISEAASGSDGHIALASCYGQLHRETLKKQLPTTVKPVSVEKCKEDTEKNECKNDSACDFSEGKCKLKECVKAENDAKTTNTTGSNSFVIHKAPLWLAVLLFLIPPPQLFSLVKYFCFIL